MSQSHSSASITEFVCHYGYKRIAIMPANIMWLYRNGVNLPMDLSFFKSPTSYFKEEGSLSINAGFKHKKRLSFLFGLFYFCCFCSFLLILKNGKGWNTEGMCIFSSKTKLFFSIILIWPHARFLLSLGDGKVS